MQMLIAGIPLLILIGHSVLTATGKMASNGELRYMLVVAPFWGLLSALGWEWVFAKLNWKSAVRWAGVAALLPALANQFYRVLPLKLMPDWEETRVIVDWYRGSGVAEKYPSLVWAHPGVSLFLDVSQNSVGGGHEWTRPSILHQMPTGTIVLWDPVFGKFNSDAKRSITFEDLTAAGWIAVARRDGLDDRGPWWILASPKDAKGDSPLVTTLPRGWTTPASPPTGLPSTSAPSR